MHSIASTLSTNIYIYIYILYSIVEKQITQKRRCFEPVYATDGYTKTFRARLVTLYEVEWEVGVRSPHVDPVSGHDISQHPHRQ